MGWRLLFAIVTAVCASAKRRNVILWFFAGFLFEWVALIILFFLPKANSSRRPFNRGWGGDAHVHWDKKVSRSCPYCGGSVAFDDIPGNWTCPNCGQTFTYGTDGHVSRMQDDRLMPQIEWIVKLFAKLAKRDGVVSENEVRLVDQLVRQAFQPTKAQLQQIMNLFNEARYSTESVESIAQNLYASVRGRRDILVDTLSALLAIAAADGAIRPEEEQMIRTAAAIFGLENDYEAIKAQFFGRSSNTTSQSMDLDACYHLLGGQPEDTDQVIKKKYRQLIRDNHPDRLMSQGASEAAIKEANSKVAEIKHAYEQIMNARVH
ncbi:TerB family tellurite resistance protein [Sporolactobacillus kofuensis]|uniref:TerB family tellurite resistance protein n=1 Tax=Sporolactobacillus kofuensis TaxID=269672 RepID=A0ABW1WEW9_9BACL|nr:TerB family tellurite resistance protein [Sporolactobacillus kofuensis]MCO7175127.1 TerB family tellurite resistance protein [Sporolactobacillus kofuensis]